MEKIKVGGCGGEQAGKCTAGPGAHTPYSHTAQTQT